MTTNKKKKLAKEYAEKVMAAKNVTYAVVHQALYEMLNARDEEVERLEKSVCDAQKATIEVAKTARDERAHRMILEKEIEILRAELVKAMNSWRDGSEKPQDTSCDYLLCYGQVYYTTAIYKNGMWMTKDLHPLKPPTKWMSLPKNEKGGKL